jgi:hypothetical protein
MERGAFCRECESPAERVGDDTDAVDGTDQEELPPGDGRQHGTEGVGAEVIAQGEEPDRASGEQDEAHGSHASERSKARAD